MAKGSAMNDNTGLPPQTPPPSYPEGFQSAPLPEAMLPPAPLPHNQPYVDPSQAPAPQQYVQPAPVPQYQPADPSAVYPQAGYPLPPVVPSHPQQVSQAAYPTTSASTDATTSLPMDAPRKKSRLGLILGVLVVVAALIVGAIFAVPYLTSSGEKELPYPLVRPSDAWANGAQKTWELKLDGAVVVSYAHGNYMITQTILEKSYRFEGWEISGTEKPKKLWEWEVQPEDEWTSLQPINNKVFALVTATDGDRYVSELDIPTGKMSAEKKAEHNSKENFVSVDLREHFYIMCQQPDAGDRAYLHLDPGRATEMFLRYARTDEPFTCTAMDYNEKVLWELNEENIPTDVAYYALNIDSGDIAKIPYESTHPKGLTESIFRVVDSDTPILQRNLNEEGPFEFAAYRADGSLIGTFKLKVPNNSISLPTSILLESLSLAEIEALATGETVDISEIAQENGYLYGQKWIDKDGKPHSLPLHEGQPAWYSLASPSGEVVAVFDYWRTLSWLYVLPNDDSAIPMSEGVDFQINPRFMVTPELAVAVDRKAGTITDYVPKD